MTLSAPRLSSAIDANISAAFTILSPSELKAVCDAIADAVVAEIISHATVTVSVVGVQTGGSTIAATGNVT